MIIIIIITILNNNNKIYNENLFDMLRDPSMTVPLTIREDLRGFIFLSNTYLLIYPKKNIHKSMLYF